MVRRNTDPINKHTSSLKPSSREPKSVCTSSAKLNDERRKTHYFNGVEQNRLVEGSRHDILNPTDGYSVGWNNAFNSGYQCRRDWFYLSLIKWNDVYEPSTHFIVAPVGLTFTLTSIISRAKATKKYEKGTITHWYHTASCCCCCWYWCLCD